MYRKSPEDPIFSTGTRGAQQTDSNIGRRPWAPPSAWVGQKFPPPQSTSANRDRAGGAGPVQTGGSGLT